MTTTVTVLAHPGTNGDGEELVVKVQIVDSFTDEVLETSLMERGESRQFYAYPPKEIRVSEVTKL